MYICTHVYMSYVHLYIYIYIYIYVCIYTPYMSRVWVAGCRRGGRNRRLRPGPRPGGGDLGIMIQLTIIIRIEY